MLSKRHSYALKHTNFALGGQSLSRIFLLLSAGSLLCVNFALQNHCYDDVRRFDSGVSTTNALGHLPLLMAHWEDSHLIIARVGCERFLQFERRNVFASANDELFMRFMP